MRNSKSKVHIFYIYLQLCETGECAQDSFIKGGAMTVSEKLAERYARNNLLVLQACENPNIQSNKWIRVMWLLKPIRYTYP